jgi:hypothetical protein
VVTVPYSVDIYRIHHALAAPTAVKLGGDRLLQEGTDNPTSARGNSNTPGQQEGAAMAQRRRWPLRLQKRVAIVILLLVVTTWQSLFYAPSLPKPPPQSCELLGEQPPKPPANRILDGAGFFTTRRRYQASLDQLSTCVKERRESDDVCSLARLSSAWRAHARLDARAAAHPAARRWSHFLDCGLIGIVKDCPQKPFEVYAARYAYDDDKCRRAPQRCPKACERLLDHATQSRPSVDRMLSPTRGLATRALLVVVFVVALAVLASATFPGYFQSQAPVLFEYMPVPASPPGYSPQSKAKRAR